MWWGKESGEERWDLTGPPGVSEGVVDLRGNPPFLFRHQTKLPWLIPTSATGPGHGWYLLARGEVSL